MRANHLKGTHVVPKTFEEKMADMALDFCKRDSVESALGFDDKRDLWTLLYLAERVHERCEAMREAPYV